MLQAFDGVMRSGGRVLNVVALGVESFDEDAVDEGTLAGTGYSGDTAESSEGDGDIDAFEIVVARSPDGDGFAVSGIT